METTNYLEEGYTINGDNGKVKIIRIPYNINNFLVEEHNIKEILSNNSVLVDKINDIDVFRRAFTHKSYIKNNIIPEDVLQSAKNELGNPTNLLELQENSYERLEYLGDRVLKLAVSFYLYKRYPDCNEGFMTRLQTKLEDKKNLAEMSKTLGLNKYFIISQQIESKNGRDSQKINEDVFEAFLGALFESNGFEVCVLLVINLLETLIDYSEKLYKDNNYKDILLRYYHTQNYKTKNPKYEVVSDEGPPNNKVYIVGVINPNLDDDTDADYKNKFISFGKASNKQDAEQNASKMALIIFNQLKEDQYDNSDIFTPDWNEINSNEIDLLIDELGDLEDELEISDSEE